MKVLCILYDDPKGGMPKSYPLSQLPKIEKYPDGMTLPSPKGRDYTPGQLLGCVSGELGLRKFLESNGHTLVVTSDKDSKGCKADKELKDADIVISTPEMMAEVGQLGKILGPQGLMPNPKTGTVTPNVAKAVEDFKKGKVEIKNDKLGNIHLSIGKVSFDESKLLENLNEVIAEVNKAKPASSKGEFIKSMHVSSTMGPSVQIDINQ